ncbi:MAG: hypothetical protein ACLRT4_14750 [Thomasclavelia sp.]
MNFKKIFKSLAITGFSLTIFSGLGGFLNFSTALWEITIIDLDFLGLFDGLCANRYEGIYNDAIEEFQREEYLLAYEDFNVCENGFKYDVSYTKKELKKNLKNCSIKYTNKKIDLIESYLETGDKNEKLDDDISIEADIIDSNQKETLSQYLKLMNYADSFLHKYENQEYWEALKYYSDKGLDGYLLSYLNKNVKECENSAISLTEEYLEEENTDKLNEIKQLMTKYSNNTSLIGNIDVLISGKKNYAVIKNYYDNEQYFELIKFVNKNSSLKEYSDVNWMYDKAVYYYTVEIEEKAKKLAGNNEFDELKILVKNAMRYVNSDKLNNLIEKYESYSNKEIWYHSLIEKSQKKEEVYVNNQLYDKTFYMWSSSKIVVKNNGNNSVSGILIADKEHLKNEDDYVNIKIYGDSLELKTITLTNNKCTESFTINNISSYGTIKVEILKGCKYNGYVYLDEFVYS